MARGIRKSRTIVLEMSWRAGEFEGFEGFESPKNPNNSSPSNPSNPNYHLRRPNDNTVAAKNSEIMDRK